MAVARRRWTAAGRPGGCRRWRCRRSGVLKREVCYQECGAPDADKQPVSLENTPEILCSRHGRALEGLTNKGSVSLNTCEVGQCWCEGARLKNA
jgi:hypothetical protein